jgi:spore maturation protein CgeB
MSEHIWQQFWATKYPNGTTVHRFRLPIIKRKSACMKILCVLGQHNYGDPARGEGYEYSNFLPALRRLGHEVIHFESFARDGYLDFADLNYRLLERVQAEKPDVILCVLLGYEIWLETLDLIRSGSHAILINWSTDDSWKYEQFSRLIARPFHVYATTYPDAVSKSQKDKHSNFVLTQWAANAERLVEPLPASECSRPVSFVGSMYGNRRKWIAALQERGIEVECFGHGSEGGAVSLEQMQRIIRESFISLNFGDSGLVLQGTTIGRSRQLKARIFEVSGAGGFVMTEQAENLENFYVPGREIVVFDGVDELVDRIKYFLEHPKERDAIAWAGYRRTQDEHIYDERFGHLLALAAQMKAENRNAAANCAIDFAQFDALRRAHFVHFPLKLLKWLLQLPCILLWGRIRGPRAARRILFEISWRVAGVKTYTASGWPGRLFYRES